MPLLGRFGFVKRALARIRIAAVVTRIDSAMIVAGLRPEATSALILIGAHSDHPHIIAHIGFRDFFFVPWLIGYDYRVWVNLQVYSCLLEGKGHHGQR